MKIVGYVLVCVGVTLLAATASASAWLFGLVSACFILGCAILGHAIILRARR